MKFAGWRQPSQGGGAAGVREKKRTQSREREEGEREVTEVESPGAEPPRGQGMEFTAPDYRGLTGYLGPEVRPNQPVRCTF